MSIVALKRKSRHYKARISGQGTDGFSLNGGHRNQGWVGQGVRGRSLTGTPYRGVAPMGNGGHLGRYVKKISNRSGSQCCTNDPSIIKRSTMNNMGRIDSSFIFPTSVFNNSCEDGKCPVPNWVKDFSPLNHSESSLTDKRARQSGKCVTLKSDAGLDGCAGPCGAASYHIGGKKYVRKMYAKNLNMHDVGGQVYQRTSLMAKVDLPTPPCKKPFPMALNHNGGCNGCQKNFMTPEEAIEGGMLPEDWMNCESCLRNGMTYTTHLDSQNIPTQTGRIGYKEEQLEKVDGQIVWLPGTSDQSLRGGGGTGNLGDGDQEVEPEYDNGTGGGTGNEGEEEEPEEPEEPEFVSMHDVNLINQVSSDPNVVSTIAEYFRGHALVNQSLPLPGYNVEDINNTFSEAVTVEDNVDVDYTLTYTVSGIDFEEMDTYMREEIKDNLLALYNDALGIHPTKIGFVLSSTGDGVSIRINYMNEDADDVEHMPFNTFTHEIQTIDNEDFIVINVYGVISNEDIDEVYQTIAESGKSNVKILGADGPLTGTQEMKGFNFNSAHHQFDILVIENITIRNENDSSYENILETDSTLLGLKDVYIQVLNSTTVNGIKLKPGVDYSTYTNVTHFDNVNFSGEYDTAIAAEGVVGNIIKSHITVENLNGPAFTYLNMSGASALRDSRIQLKENSSSPNITVSNDQQSDSFSLEVDYVTFIHNHSLIYKETEYGSVCVNNYSILDINENPITDSEHLAENSSPVGGLSVVVPGTTFYDTQHHPSTRSTTNADSGWVHLDFTNNVMDGDILDTIEMYYGSTSSDATSRLYIYEEDPPVKSQASGQPWGTEISQSELVSNDADINTYSNLNPPVVINTSKKYYARVIIFTGIIPGRFSYSATIPTTSSVGGLGGHWGTPEHKTIVTRPESEEIAVCE